MHFFENDKSSPNFMCHFHCNGDVLCNFGKKSVGQHLVDSFSQTHLVTLRLPEAKNDLCVVAGCRRRKF
jgi:hypothetical protein